MRIDMIYYPTDLGDQPEVRLHDPAELLLHPLQPPAQGPLDLGQGYRGRP